MDEILEDILMHELTSDEKLEAWGLGEWVEEADYCEFDHKGYVGIVKRVYYKHGNGPIELGHFCGYVVIPKGHPWHGKDYGNLDCEVHGGLTYHESLQHFDYVIGFDCAHSGDICPGTAKIMQQSRKSIEERFPELNLHKTKLWEESYKNMDFVKEEIKKLVDQAIDAQEGTLKEPYE